MHKIKYTIRPTPPLLLMVPTNKCTIKFYQRHDIGPIRYISINCTHRGVTAKWFYLPVDSIALRTLSYSAFNMVLQY